MIRTLVTDYDIILATFNGAKYLLPQLESISSQTIPPIRVFIADDLLMTVHQIIKDWACTQSFFVHLLPKHAARLGSCANFERLLSSYLTSSSSSFVMLSDQDDIWHRNKAEKLLLGMNYLLDRYGSDLPLAVHCDLCIIDHCGTSIFDSFTKYQQLDPTKDSCLSVSLQNIITGCSSIFNRSCIECALPFSSEAILHDWWLAMVASRLGHIKFIADPLVLYRQHANNLVGATSLSSRMKSRIVSLNNPNYVDRWIGSPLRQLQSLFKRFPLSDAVGSMYLDNLLCDNASRRVLSALYLGLAKHGFLRTTAFYILLLLWKPSEE